MITLQEKTLPKNTEKFFKHFESIIHEKGKILNKKILKLVAQKFNKEDKLLKENSNLESLMLYLSKDDDLFRNIFGFGLNDW